MLLGLLPRRATGVERFAMEHPEADGRGVLIGIMDSGLDAGLPGLRHTTTGEPKILDVRDFSGEGRIALTRVSAVGDVVIVAGQTLRGFGRVAALSTGPYYGGGLIERTLGPLPAADVNGDGDANDALPIVVARASDGWLLFADTDGDGSLADEAPVRDYSVAGDTYTYGPLTIAANFDTVGGAPRLDLFFDTAGHGTHVTGIAAGHDLFGVTGFDGIAPGAQVLGLKIANDARGGISVTGSMLHAMVWAADYAARRRLPLVLNLSFGIGNEDGTGVSAIDSIIDAFALVHPDVAIVISAGNDGPGTSTIGFPGSAEFALSACALFPGAFAQAPNVSGPPAEDVLGWWSSRGGRFGKPDVCVPGVAFSNVPPWQIGNEVAAGTSMAAPQLAGLAALLQSALLDEGGIASAAAVSTALRATAAPMGGTTILDEGTGIPDVTAAYRWLRSGHRAGRFAVSALPDGGNTGITAAYRRSGLAPGDTIQRFRVTSESGQPFARLLLGADAPWLHAPRTLDFSGAPATVPVTYDTRALEAPGLYVGTVWARPATDTIAGAAFGFTNTIVVPYDLTRELLHRRQYLAPGRVARFFMTVPADAGGLRVQVRVGDPEQAVSLYLFEPTGQPQRERSSVEVGGDSDAVGALRVRADDIVPGVYEVVLVAPPTRAVTAEVEAALAPIRVTEVGDAGLRLANRLAHPVSAAVAARAVGVARSVALRGTGGDVARTRVDVPSWASTLELDIAFPRQVWPRITDVGLSAWDSTGHFIAEGALDYPSERHRIALDSIASRTLDVELMPAFALPDDRTPWEAHLNLVFLRREPPAPTDTAPTHLRALADTIVTWSVDSLAVVPPGFDALVEVTAVVDGEVPSVRWVRVPSAASTR